MEVSITGLGTLANEIASPDAPPPACSPVRISSSTSSYSTPDANNLTLSSGQRLHVEDNKAEGKPAVVFIHGLGGASTSFHAIIATTGLQQTHRVILIDWEGHGLSQLTGSALAVPALARSVFEVLNNLKVDKATIVGHSMGGVSQLVSAAPLTSG
jgi:pimeloyl-ACP methyl ester carboxylesterase